MVIKYKVEKAFTDKYTKKSVFANSIIDVDINRMKELNEKNIGRVVDIIEDEIQETKEDKKTVVDETSKDEETKDKNEETEKTSTEKYTAEQLEAMTVNELKELADSKGYKLTKAIKKEIIQEIIELQEK